ncbi:metal-independent alpha-mannosidase [Chloropicon roscoffensis]|uniref:Metal-independent alpha-mannosidase n=1 Tax=Chloropicon roscoffensis TaxID=1461544 RepID=A0AAX4PGT2_9CHLO
MVTLSAMRAFVAYAALLAMAPVSSMSGALASDSVGCHKTRPSPARRKFSSPEVDLFLLDTVPRLRDQIAQTFNVCLPNALDSTFVVAGRDDSFVITGDIDAMWLRDSTFQVLPYVRYFLKQGHRTELSDAVCGLVRRQARSVLIDRYANAFNLDARGRGGPIRATGGFPR